MFDARDDNSFFIPPAIKLENVSVRLGKTNVLRSITLCIKQGGIFALLGPSGCGKTSLIRTLTGLLTPTKNEDGSRGTVSILGRGPHAFGQMVGFMPQEMALHNTNTIDEELFFYGKLTNMSTAKIKQRRLDLRNLLQLPDGSRFINQLSGGQQRRVSFSIALLHEPKLIILDEPTVGVDPLLRKKIWQHLVEITSKGDVTAILSTHYIDEARQANRISFMRDGILLETGQPDELLIKHNRTNLEEVFLELCEGSDVLQIRNDQINRIEVEPNITIRDQICDCGKSVCSKCSNKCRCISPPLGSSLHALLKKDIKKFQRNPFMLFIQFVVPILQITLFCLCIGRKLTDLPVGFVSREINRSGSFTEIIFNKIDRNVLNLIEYKSIDEAQQNLKLGIISGIFDIGANFSREFFDKVNHCSFTESSKFNDSQLSVYLDETNRQFVYSVAEEFIRVLKEFDVEFNLGHFTSGRPNETIFRLGVLSDENYGVEFSFTHFMVPGIVLSVIFFFNVALTALFLVIEQVDGTQERTWITGVKTSVLILSQMIVHSVILIAQIGIVLFTAIYLFKIPSRGNLIWSSLLCFCQGFCGMTFGLVIATIFTTEINAHQVTMATFYPVLLLSGIVWPLEGQPLWMRTVTRWLPMTRAIDAMRGILLKAWGIEHTIVQQAFSVALLWSIFFTILALTIYNIRRFKC